MCVIKVGCSAGSGPIGPCSALLVYALLHTGHCRRCQRRRAACVGVLWRAAGTRPAQPAGFKGLPLPGLLIHRERALMWPVFFKSRVCNTGL